ncbi:MAG: lysophospholipid acyltransferase family protein [Thermoanaerobaculia bacterium]
MVDRMSLAGALRVMRGVSDLWFALDRKRRRVAVENILASEIVDTPHAARRVARASARHFGTVLVESLKSAEILGGERWRENVTLEMHPEVLAALADPERGVLVASAHFGNWEVAAQILSLFKPVVGIVRRNSNRHVQALLERRKPRFRFRLTDEWVGDPTRFFSILAEGRALALLVDLDARGRGIPVDFFARPAATHTTLPMLHLLTGAPLVFGYCLRTGPGRFLVRSAPLVTPPKTGRRVEDCRAILEVVHQRLEAAIRSAPEQYLWAHGRWKHGHWRPGMPGVGRGESIPAAAAGPLGRSSR